MNTMTTLNANKLAAVLATVGLSARINEALGLELIPNIPTETEDGARFDKFLDIIAADEALTAFYDIFMEGVDVEGEEQPWEHIDGHENKREVFSNSIMHSFSGALNQLIGRIVSSGRTPSFDFDNMIALQSHILNKDIAAEMAAETVH